MSDDIANGALSEGFKFSDDGDDMILSRLDAYEQAWNNVKTLYGEGLKTGGIEDIESFQASLNQMISAAGMSYDEITSMLGSMGIDAEIKTDGKM